MNKKQQLKKRLLEINTILAEIDGARSLRDYNIGDTLSIKFRDVTIILRKVGNNVFTVISSGNSQKIEKDDLLRINDLNSRLEPGETIEFEIFRKALDYRSDPIEIVS